MLRRNWRYIIFYYLIWDFRKCCCHECFYNKKNWTHNFPYSKGHYLITVQTHTNFQAMLFIKFFTALPSLCVCFSEGNFCEFWFEIFLVFTVCNLKKSIGKKHVYNSIQNFFLLHSGHWFIIKSQTFVHVLCVII